MTAPLTPPDCDLRDFGFMPLDVQRLRDSNLAAMESPEACWAAVLLWAASWHQVPAASLPDDDRALANLAGYGRVVDAWLPVREGALRSFVKCDDGRLYHPVVAEKALEAWRGKLEQRWRSECARIKKSNQRHGKDDQFPTLVEFLAARVPPVSLTCPEGRQQLSLGTIEDVPRDVPTLSLPCPSGNSIQGKGIGTVKEEEISEANASSGGSAEPIPPVVEPKDEQQDLIAQLAESAKPKPKAKWERDALFLEAWDACTPDMRSRSNNREKTWPIWMVAAMKAGGPETLLAALRAYLAGDKDVQRTGGPAFHRWLRDGTWEHWLPRAEAIGATATTWPGPSALRAAIVEAKSEGWAVSYIDRSGWRDIPKPALIPATQFAAKVIATEVGHILRQHGVEIERAAA